MTTITFDTYHFVERLEKAGMPREQAAAIAEAQKESLAEALDSRVVSRSDLFEVKAALKADLLEVKAELKTDIARLDMSLTSLRSEMLALEYRLIIKLGAFMAVTAGIIIAVLRLPH